MRAETGASAGDTAWLACPRAPLLAWVAPTDLQQLRLSGLLVHDVNELQSKGKVGEYKMSACPLNPSLRRPFMRVGLCHEHAACRSSPPTSLTLFLRSSSPYCAAFSLRTASAWSFSFSWSLCSVCLTWKRQQIQLGTRKELLTRHVPHEVAHDGRL